MMKLFTQKHLSLANMKLSKRKERIVSPEKKINFATRFVYNNNRWGTLIQKLLIMKINGPKLLNLQKACSGSTFASCGTTGI